MSRFRYSGVNWAGQTWKASAAMQRLGMEIEVKYPVGQITDGTVASKAHDAASPKSDHRPSPLTGLGTVRAIDIGVVSISQGNEITEHLRASKDPRIKYIIFNKRIFSSYGTTPWVWRPYYGSNPHTTHAHVSFEAAADNDPSPWGIATLKGDEEMIPEGQMQTLLAAINDVAKQVMLWGYDPEAVPPAPSNWQLQLRTNASVTDIRNKVNAGLVTPEQIAQLAQEIVDQGVGQAVVDAIDGQMKLKKV